MLFVLFKKTVVVSGIFNVNWVFQKAVSTFLLLRKTEEEDIAGVLEDSSVPPIHNSSERVAIRSLLFTFIMTVMALLCKY